MRLLLGIVALLAATPAMATDFVLAGRAGSAAQILADRDSIQRPEEGHVVVHMLYVLAEDRRGVAALDMTNEYDCTNRRYRRLRIGGIDAQGKSLGPDEKNLEWRDAVDGDTSGGILDFICTGEVSGKDATSLGGSLPEVIAESRRRLASKASE